MAGLAYRGRGNVTQLELNEWFRDTAQDREDIVTEWEDNSHSAVSFKMVTFPKHGNFSYVLIRGTTNNWDMLTDAQLWIPAMFMQGLRELLPFGAIWTPAIDELIKITTKVESKSISRVSFYRDTTAFVKYLLDSVPQKYAGVVVTGHSLGGGLAMITGAQTNVSAIALSGPNAMLSRASFDPPITAEALNTRTFNIIPERDLVATIDQKAQNYQNIRCSSKDVTACHDSTRSLCEILYACGTGNRPFLCECVTKYNYPEPKRKRGVDPNISFRQACGLS